MKGGRNALSFLRPRRRRILTEKVLAVAVNIPYRARLVIEEYHHIKEVILYTSLGKKVPLGVSPAQLRHNLMELPLTRNTWDISKFTTKLPSRMRKSLNAPFDDQLIKLSIIEETRGLYSLMYLFSFEELLRGLPVEEDEDF